MESQLTPQVIFTVREFNSENRVIQEHIFLGDLVSPTELKDLNQGRIYLDSPKIKSSLKNFRINYNQSQNLQKFYPLLINYNDKIQEIIQKLVLVLKNKEFYFWLDNYSLPTTHQIQNLEFSPNPFEYQPNKQVPPNPSIKDLSGHLLRSKMDSQNSIPIINLITLPNLKNLIPVEHLSLYYPKSLWDQVPTPNLNQPDLATANLTGTNYDLKESRCLTRLLLDQDLPVQLRDDRLEQVRVKIDNSRMEQCFIQINPPEENQPSFLNLESIFRLTTLEGDLIFSKIRKGDRSISKINRNLSVFRDQVSKEELTNWSDIEELNRGLLFKKVKESFGLVIIKIHQTGYIELQLNWISEEKLRILKASSSGRRRSRSRSRSRSRGRVYDVGVEDQIQEILKEIDFVNELILSINRDNTRLPEFESARVPLADRNFLINLQTNTKLNFINFQTKFKTGKTKQIRVDAFNHFVETFGYYLFPIYPWRIFNGRDIKVERANISEVNLLYLRTDNNLAPDQLTGVLFGLGLVGSVYKDQNALQDVVKELIVSDENQRRIFRKTQEEVLPLESSEEVEARIREIKEGNPGIVLTLKYLNSKYTLTCKGVNTLAEVQEINNLMERLMSFYFQYGYVFHGQYRKNYNCALLEFSLNQDQEYQPDEKRKTSTKSKKEATKTTLFETVSMPFQLEEEDEMLVLEPEMTMDDQPTELKGDETGKAMKFLEQTTEDDFIQNIRKSKEPLSAKQYLDQLSGVFSKGLYRRFSCTKNFPIYMSKRNFWHNFDRIAKRLKTIIDDPGSLTTEQRKEFEKRFPGSLTDQTENALKEIIKMAILLEKRHPGSKNSPQRTLLREIEDLAYRYQHGTLLKVPTSEEMNEYTREYFFICPHSWCFFCQESKFSDELSENRTNCLACENRIYQVETKNNKIVGFSSNKNAPDFVKCLPCCFKAENKFTARAEFCNARHPTKDVKMITQKIEKGKIDTGNILTGDAIPAHKFGYLDGKKSGPLNDFFNFGTEIDKIKNNVEVFLLKGVEDVPIEDSFLEALSHYLTEGKNRRKPSGIREYLANRMDSNIFFALNNGLIAGIFKTPDNTWDEALDNFRIHLSINYLDENILWHLFTLPGIFFGDIFDEESNPDAKKGMNLIIINRTSTDRYTLQCPIGPDLASYYRPDRPTAVMLKLEKTGRYYPVSIVSYEVGYEGQGEMTTRSPYYNLIFDPVLTIQIGRLLNFAIQSCADNWATNNPYLPENQPSLKTVLDELSSLKILDKKEEITILFNHFGQVIYVVGEAKSNKEFLIPVQPRSIPNNLDPITREYRTKFVEYNLRDYNLASQTQVENLISKIRAESKGISVQVRGYIQDSLGLVEGIKLENLLVFPFEPVPSQRFKPGYQNKPIMIDPNPADVDFATSHQSLDLDDRKLYVNQTLFQKESYQRLRLEISDYLKNSATKQKITDLLKADNQPDEQQNISNRQRFSQLEKILSGIIKEVSQIGKPNYATYRQVNIRKVCHTRKSTVQTGQQQCQDDPHCKTTVEGCKVLLPERLILPNNQIKVNSYSRYATILTDEILRNSIKRDQILNHKVIQYVNPAEIYFNVEKEFLIDELNFAEQVEELYRSAVDAPDQIRNNYFTQTSEVFGRERDQILFYFPDDQWYQKSGLSRNEYVINIDNIYSLLDGVLKTEVADQIWEYIDQHEWKLWLNALRSERPEEYQSIIQYTQFKEYLKFGQPFLSQIHLHLLSHLNKIEIMTMVHNSSRKFQCLPGTSYRSDPGGDQTKFLLLYQFDQDTIYLVAKTPHLDLEKKSDLTYLHPEKTLPDRFVKSFQEQCPRPTKTQLENQRKFPERSINQILENYPVTGLKQLQDDTQSIPDIRKEKIILPPKGPKISLKKKPPSDKQKEKIQLKPKPKEKIQLKPKKEKIQIKPRSRSTSRRGRSKSPRGRKSPRSRSTSRKRSPRRARPRSRSNSRK